MIFVILIVLGLCLGSFINALVWRLHEQSKAKDTKRRTKNKKLSILQGRSMCVHCEHELAATDLVPVFSWITLRGKCRYCHQPISWQYPIIELLVPLLFVMSYTCWPYGWQANGLFQFIIWLTFLVGLVALTVYDLRWMLLPNKIVYILLGLSIASVLGKYLLATGGVEVLMSSIWGFICVGGFFYLLFQVSAGKWIGGGDVKLGFVLGILVDGPLNSLLLLFFASLLGSVISVPLLVSKTLKRTSRIPFGPFLISSALVVYLFGTAITNWYKHKLLGF